MIYESQISMPQKSLAQINVQGQLGREYRETFEVPLDQVNNVNTVFPVRFLLQQSAIFAILRRYAYFTFKGVKVRIVITSLPQQFGAVRVTHMPWISDNSGILSTTYPFEYMYQRNPILLPIADQSGCEITLPFVFSHPMFPLRRDMYSVAAQQDLRHMHVLRFSVLGDVVATTVDSNIYVELYYSFVDPQVSGPVQYSTDPAPVGEAQADQQGMFHPGLYAMAGATAVNFNTLVETYKSAMGTAQEVLGEVKKGKAFKDEIAGLWKENHEERATIQNDSFGELSQAAFSTGYRSLLYKNPELVDPKSYADDNLRHSLYKIMRDNPMHIVTQIMPSGTATYLRPHPIFEQPSELLKGYMAYFGQFFKFWSGSLEYSFVICASSFVSGKFYVSMDFDSASGVSPVSGVGNAPTICQSIKGQTTVSVNVPFVFPFARHPTNYMTQQLYMCSDRIVRYQTGPLYSAGDRTPSIVVSVFVRPGPDFQYHEPQGVTTPVIGEAQMDAAQIFQNVQDFPGLSHSPSDPWPMTVEDLMTRWSKRPAPGSSPYTLEWRRTLPYTDVRKRSNYDYLAPLFAFNCGGITTKIVARPATVSTSTETVVSFLPSFNEAGSILEFANPAAGMCASLVSHQPVLDFEQPYRNWYDVDWNANLIFPDVADAQGWENFPQTTDIDLCWVKIGPRYQLFHLLPPPWTIYWPWYID